MSESLQPVGGVGIFTPVSWFHRDRVTKTPQWYYSHPKIIHNQPPMVTYENLITITLVSINTYQNDVHFKHQSPWPNTTPRCSFETCKMKAEIAPSPCVWSFELFLEHRKFVPTSSESNASRNLSTNGYITRKIFLWRPLLAEPGTMCNPVLP